MSPNPEVKRKTEERSEPVKTAKARPNVRKLTEEEVERITKPIVEAKGVFEYLARWRSNSLRSKFQF
jgi:hypothetical protein